MKIFQKVLVRVGGATFFETSCILLVVLQGCMPNGCCRSGSGKLISDHQYPYDTYVMHDGHVASCTLLNSHCSSHRVCCSTYWVVHVGPAAVIEYAQSISWPDGVKGDLNRV